MPSKSQAPLACKWVSAFNSNAVASVLLSPAWPPENSEKSAGKLWLKSWENMMCENLGTYYWTSKHNNLMGIDDLSRAKYHVRPPKTELMWSMWILHHTGYGSNLMWPTKKTIIVVGPVKALVDHSRSPPIACKRSTDIVSSEPGRVLCTSVSCPFVPVNG